MTSETIKVLLMISLFCGLQASLHWPRLAISRTTKRWRRAMTLYRPELPTYTPVGYALTPVWVGRSRH